MFFTTGDEYHLMCNVACADPGFATTVQEILVNYIVQSLGFEIICQHECAIFSQFA